MFLRVQVISHIKSKWMPWWIRHLLLSPPFVTFLLAWSIFHKDLLLLASILRRWHRLPLWHFLWFSERLFGLYIFLLRYFSRNSLSDLWIFLFRSGSSAFCSAAYAFKCFGFVALFCWWLFSWFAFLCRLAFDEAMDILASFSPFTMMAFASRNFILVSLSASALPYGFISCSWRCSLPYLLMVILTSLSRWVSAMEMSFSLSASAFRFPDFFLFSYEIFASLIVLLPPSQCFDITWFILDVSDVLHWWASIQSFNSVSTF